MSRAFSAEMIFFLSYSDQTKVLQWLLNAKQSFRLEEDEQPNKRALAHAADKIMVLVGIIGPKTQSANKPTV